MRSKAPLALMEQAVMVLVFALAAALCLRVFVWSDRTAKRSVALDRAVVEVQNAAEIIKHEGGSGLMPADAALDAAAARLGAEQGADGAAFEIFYSDDWSQVRKGDHSYVLRAGSAGDGDPDGLSAARVWVTTEDPEDIIFDITVAWQSEVRGS